MVQVTGRLLPLALAVSAVVGCTGGDGSRRQGAETGVADSAADTTPAFPADKLRVTNVMIGKRVGARNLITEPTFQFAPGDTVYLSVGTEGVPASATLSTKWVSQKGEVLDSSSKTINPKGAENTVFQVSRPKGWAVGVYKVEVFADGDSVDAKTFAIRK
jgi:hypothetical protein